MAFDYTNLYPDTSGNGGYTKSWNYTTVGDSIATCSASGYFNKVATRLGIGDNIVIAVVDAFDKTRTALVDKAILFVTGIAGGVVTTSIYAPPASIPDSAALTGVPTAPTAAVDTNTTQIATTAMVLAQAASATPLIDGTAAVGASTRFARGDHVHPTDTTRAPLASPTLTGTPATPNATVDTNTTQIANTAFVIGQAASATPLIDGAAAVGTSTRFARGDHVHPTDTTRAPLASPTFAGVPAVPNVAVDVNTTQIANTAFVIGQAAAATPLVDGTAAVGTSTRFARADHVHPTENAAWVPFTPTITSQTGTFTTVSCAMRYKQIGKTVFYGGTITFTTLGTATGRVTLSPPAPMNTNFNQLGVGYGPDQQVAVIVSNNLYSAGNIDLSSPTAGAPYTAAGQRVVFAGQYEAT